jgi:hypothetical protein
MESPRGSSVKKVLKLSSLLVAVLLLSVLSGVQLVSAAVTDATLGQEFVSNAAPADNTFDITITDTDRDTDSGAGTDTIGASAIKIENITDSVSINVTTTAAMETGVGVFTVAITVTSSTSSASGFAIQADDGDQIQVTYTTAGSIAITALTALAATSITVDAAGPVIVNYSPADGTKTRFPDQIFQAEVSDAGIGLGATTAEVKGRVSIWVLGAELSPTVTDLTGGDWRATRGTTFSGDQTITWYVSAEDELGNTSRTDSDGDNDPDLTIILDTTAPSIVEDAADTDSLGNVLIATTGDAPDTSTATTTISATDNRASIRVGFNEDLDGDSVNADGTDFLVLVGETQLTITGAAWYSHLPQHVFLTLGSDLDAADTPVVRVVREITDVAGTPKNTGEVTAIDGIAPALTVTVTGSNDSLTNETLVVQVSADESSANPTATTGVTVREDSDDDGVADLDPGAPTFATVTDLRTWTWTYTFETDGTEDGVYNVYVSISDTAGNAVTHGVATAVTSTDAVVFQVDSGIPDPAVTPTTSDNVETFVNVSYTGEASEYGGDTNSTISSLTATVDGESVTTNTIDNVTYTIAAPSGGYTEGDHTLITTATDVAGNEVEFTQTVTITARAAISIALRPGFNIISLPGNPASTAINDVIGVSHPINQVLTYDPGVDGGWLIAERGDDGLFAGTLTTIDSNLAYIVRTTTFEALEVNVPRLSVGAQVLPPTVSLSDGWNLVPAVDLSGDLAAGGTLTGYFTGVGVKILTLDSLGRLGTLAGADATVGTGYWVFSDGADVLVP